MWEPDTLRQFIVKHLTKNRASLIIAALVGYVMAVPTLHILNAMPDNPSLSFAFMLLFLIYMAIWHQLKDDYAYWRYQKRKAAAG